LRFVVLSVYVRPWLVWWRLYASHLQGCLRARCLCRAQHVCLSGSVDRTRVRHYAIAVAKRHRCCWQIRRTPCRHRVHCSGRRWHVDFVRCWRVCKLLAEATSRVIRRSVSIPIHSCFSPPPWAATRSCFWQRWRRSCVAQTRSVSIGERSRVGFSSAKCVGGFRPGHERFRGV
jgi:hypothetical protein